MPRFVAPCLAVVFCCMIALAAEPAPAPAVLPDGGPGWRAMTQEDFINVNCDEDTWTWHEDGLIECTGSPVGVIRTPYKVTNLELSVEWKHLKHAGNSGVFLWVTDDSVADLGRNKLPHGIEVQILDHGYKEDYEKDGKKADWFTCNGDVFSVGTSKMNPFPPVSPDGTRSFPTKELSKGVGEWNHYYIRAINGEVRLWVNGEEVSGGNNCVPATGYLALESEGSPIQFRNLKIRQLP